MSLELEIKNENIRKFLGKVAGDKELQAQLAKIRKPEEAYKLASSVQGGFTQEEFTTEMNRIFLEVTKDLSEEDVAKIAGGELQGAAFSAVWGVATIAGGTAVVGIGAAAAGAFQ